MDFADFCFKAVGLAVVFSCAVLLLSMSLWAIVAIWKDLLK